MVVQVGTSVRVLFEGTGNGRAFAPRTSGSDSVLGLARQATEVDGLTEDERSLMIQAGMANAARLVRDEARKRVKVVTGTLRRSIKVNIPGRIKVNSRSRSSNPETVQADFVRLEVSAPHWYIIEFGRKAGETDWGTWYPSAPAYPYLNPALDSTQEEQFTRCIIGMRTRWVQIVREKSRRKGRRR